MVEVPVTQETPAAQRPPLVDTIITLISEATLSPQQPPQTQPKRSKIKRILKKSNKPETQVDIAALDNRVSRLEKKVNAMSRFNIQAAIDKSIEARIKKNDLLKDVPDFHKLKQEKSAKKSMPKSSTTSFDESSLDEYDHKNKLLRLIKPLALHGALGHLTIPVYFFFNKYLEDLTNGNAEKKYATSLTKPKAASYDLEGIVQMIPKLWGSFKILSIVRLSIDKQFGYGYLKEIVVRHANQKEYTFKEADFLRLHLNDIKNLYLLYAQNKLHHLTGNE
ncbi:hypothetical protein Tco_1076377 [Tanacetum coccineum]